MRAIQVRCPQCGAGLNVDDGASSVTCQYCGTVSRVQGRSRILQVPRPLPADGDGGVRRPVARQQVNRAAIVVPLVMFLGMGAFSALMVMRSVNRIKIPGVPGIPGAPKQVDTWSSAKPVLVDVDGDGGDDLVGLTRNVLDGDRAQLAAHSGRDGKQLWKTAKLGTYSDTVQAVVFVSGGMLLMATPSGELKAFDVKSGEARWTVPLGERVRDVCSDGEAGAVTIGTADQRWHRVAVADGARTDREAPKVIDRGGGARQLPPLAWVAAEIPADACVPVDTSERDEPAGLATADSWSEMPKVEGMRVERVVRRGGGGPVVAIGAKDPGTAVPTLAVIEDMGAKVRVRWKAVIPAADPLESRVEDEHVTVGREAAFVVYETKNGPPRVTALSMADGRRLWDQPLQQRTHVVLTGVMMAGGGTDGADGAGGAGERVVVSTWGNLQAFDAATGAPAYLVGGL